MQVSRLDRVLRSARAQRDRTEERAETVTRLLENTREERDRILDEVGEVRSRLADEFHERERLAERIEEVTGREATLSEELTAAHMRLTSVAVSRPWRWGFFLSRAYRRLTFRKPWRDPLAGYLPAMDEGKARGPASLVPPAHAVDVVLCAGGDAQRLREAIHVLRSKTALPFHLIVADSRDAPAITAETAELLAAIEATETVVVDGPISVVSAIAAVAPISAAPWLAIVSDSVRPTFGWLDRLLACAGSDDGIALVGCVTDPPDEVPARREWLTEDGIGLVLGRAAARKSHDATTIPAECFAVRRQALEGEGGLRAGPTTTRSRTSRVASDGLGGVWCSPRTSTSTCRAARA